MSQLPSVCRQVHYISTVDVNGDIVDPWSATIVRVNEDGTVNLDAIEPTTGRHVFLPNREEWPEGSIVSPSGRWMWPPRMTTLVQLDGREIAKAVADAARERGELA